MKIKFKIFCLEYEAEVTSAGYSDGYGKEYDKHPLYKAAKFPPLCRNEYDTEWEAIAAIETHGYNWTEYVIQKIYFK